MAGAETLVAETRVAANADDVIVSASYAPSHLIVPDFYRFFKNSFSTSIRLNVNSGKVTTSHQIPRSRET